jgi:hypothetical protein
MGMAHARKSIVRGAWGQRWCGLPPGGGGTFVVLFQASWMNFRMFQKLLVVL